MTKPVVPKEGPLGKAGFISRKKFIGLTAMGLCALPLPPLAIQTAKRSFPIKAVAFDAYALYDTRSLVSRAETLYPGMGTALMSAWRTRQFEYTWLRCLSRHYADFRKVTADALAYAIALLKLDPDMQKKAALMQAFEDMCFVPEAEPVLRQLKSMSLQLAILSNVTPAILEAAIHHSGLEGVFDFVISTDSIKTYKPDPAAYQLGVDAFKVSKEEILFVAFGGWDEAGAKQFGFPTAWINAGALPVEELDVQPDVICGNLWELLAFVKENSPANEAE